MFFPTIVICNVLTALCFTFVYHPADPTKPTTLAKCQRDIEGLAAQTVLFEAPKVDGLKDAPAQIDYCCLPKDVSNDKSFRGCPRPGQES